MSNSPDKLTYLQLYPDDLMSLIMRTGEPPQVTGARLRLWCIAAKSRPNGTLIACESSLHHWSGLTEKTWAKWGPIITGDWELKDGYYHIRRIQAQMEKRLTEVAKRSAAGKKANKVRWSARSESDPKRIPNGSESDPHQHQHCIKSSATPLRGVSEHRPATPRRGVSGDKRHTNTPTPDAVLVARDALHRFPPKAWYARIAETVGTDPKALDQWRSILVDWVGRGYNPSNIKGQLEAFTAGKIDKNGDNKPAGFDGIKQWWEDQDGKDE